MFWTHFLCVFVAATGHELQACMQVCVCVRVHDNVSLTNLHIDSTLIMAEPQ